MNLKKCMYFDVKQGGYLPNGENVVNVLNECLIHDFIITENEHSGLVLFARLLRPLLHIISELS